MNNNKLSSTSDERKAIQSAVESYYALPGVPDSELESVDLQDFFNDNGVLIADRPQNWVLLASLGRHSQGASLPRSNMDLCPLDNNC